MRNRLTRRPLSHRPTFETLEQRLPPSDALLGLLVAWPEAEFTDPMRVEAGSTLRLTPDRTDSLVDNGYSVRTPTVQTDADESSNTDRAASVSARPTPLPTGRGSDDFRRLAQLSMPFHAVDYLAPGNPVRNDALSLFAAPSGVSTMASGTALPVPTAIPDTSAEKSSDIAENFGQLPLSFEQNVGQTYASVDFMARAGGYTAFLTPTGAVFSIQGSGDRGEGSALQNSEFRTQNSELKTQNSQLGVALHMEIVGANSNARAVGVSPLSGKVNYFIGNDPSQWHTNISTFGAVQYDDVYPGIDLVYYGKDQQLEYDFVVSPGADPNAITLSFAGADGMELDADGNLVLHTAAGDLVQQNPFTYQQIGETRQEVASAYEVNGQEIRFDVGTYDPARPLVIDPLVLGYSTYLGASGSGIEEGHAIAVDGDGSAYVAGRALLTNFPVTPGAFDTVPDGSNDAFVAKLNPTGTALAYATYLGGSGVECVYSNASGIKVDDGGHAYVTSDTTSTDFPTTPGAFDTTLENSVDVFVTKLSPNGDALIYSTYLGGSNTDVAYDLAIDAGGNAFITGSSSSSDFPITPGAYDTTHFDIFVTKVNSTGSLLLYSTFANLGGDSFQKSFLALDDLGNVFVAGFDSQYYYMARVQKLNATGTALSYSFQVGPVGALGGIAVDAAGRAYVTGWTGSDDFVVTPGAFDTTFNGGEAFLTELNAAGSFILYSTFLGGSSYEYGKGIALDENNNVYLTGTTASTDFPTTPDAFDSSSNGELDVYVTKLNTYEPAFIYSTYLGGNDDDEGWSIALDSNNNVYATGRAHSGFPTTPGALKPRTRGNWDAFVTKLVES